MIVKSDQLCCYLEGVAVPIIYFKAVTVRDKLIEADITLPIADFIVPKMWANALVQVTYIENKNGTRQEKLLFEGLCEEVVAHEQKSLTELKAISTWKSMNMNTVLDYTSPKRYGMQQLENGLVIHVGPEEDVYVGEFPSNGPSYNLSRRYFNLESSDDVGTLNPDSPDALKLEFIVQRTPFAERYAFSLFEDIAFSNFLLSRSYIDRFNLLNKSKKRGAREKEDLNILLQLKYKQVPIDVGRTKLLEKYLKVFDRTSIKDYDDVGGSVKNIPSGEATGKPTNFQDYIKNDPRARFVTCYKAKDRQWGDQLTCERILVFAEKIFNKYGQKTLVGDMSGPPNGSGYAHNSGHETHNDGSAVDIVIQTITNSTASDYNRSYAIEALKILIYEVGVRNKEGSIYFDDAQQVRIKQFWPQPEFKNIVKSIGGHNDHFHVFFVERK